MRYPVIAPAGLSLSDPCDSTENICTWTYDRTGSPVAANLADWLVGKPLVLLGLVLLGIVVRWLLHRIIDRIVDRAEEGMLPDRVGRAVLAGRVGDRMARTEAAGATRRVQRAQTMGTLLKSIVSGVVVAVVVTMMLSEVGVDIGPIVASAGILGVALGFGAQSLVKDFLSGIFMIFEDQYGVGDVVDVGEATGTVEAVSLRVTRLRDVNGTVWYVRNGEILRVGNMSQNWARTVLDVTVGYGEDLVRVRRVLEEVAHDLWEDEEFEGLVIEQPEVWGVESMSVDGIVVRVTLKTAPMEQWAVARAMRERIKARFEHEGINLAVAQRVQWQSGPAQAPSAAAAAAPADDATPG